MSHLPIQHENETAPGKAGSWRLHWQAKLRAIDSCQNGTCADRDQKTNNAGSGALRYTIIFLYMPDGSLTRSLFIRILAILMKFNKLLTAVKLEYTLTIII